MKRFHNWFIGDCLAKTNNVFERAKIELLYYYSLVFIFLGTVFYVMLWLGHFTYHFYSTTFAVVALVSLPFILKYTGSIRIASNWYVIQQCLISVCSVTIQGGKPDISGAYWTTLFILIVFFLYTLKWAVIIFVIQSVLIGVGGALSQIFTIPPDQRFPDEPKFFSIPLLLNFFAVIMYTITRSKAEKQITLQRVMLETKNKEVTDSINYAQRIQKAILPSQRLIEHYLPQSFVVYLPKDIVSGDFYWVEKKGDVVFFAVVDCTGHGVPGAMMSVIAQNALNRVLNEFAITQPALILDKLNELVEEALSKSGGDIRDGMDLALCALNEKTLRMEYAGANNAIYVIRKNELTEYKPDKQPIGRFEKRFPFSNRIIPLEKGDCVYLFSDGIADQFGGPDGKKFKYKRVKELLQNTSGENTLSQKNSVLSAFYDWKGKQEQIDDVCIFGVKI